jgi:hypothetical protein
MTYKDLSSNGHADAGTKPKELAAAPASKTATPKSVEVSKINEADLERFIRQHGFLIL